MYTITAHCYVLVFGMLKVVSEYSNKHSHFSGRTCCLGAALSIKHNYLIILFLIVLVVLVTDVKDIWLSS